MKSLDGKWLSVRMMRKSAENRVFRTNVSVVENKRVVFCIDCYNNSLCLPQLLLHLLRCREAPKERTDPPASRRNADV